MAISFRTLRLIKKKKKNISTFKLHNTPLHCSQGFLKFLLSFSVQFFRSPYPCPRRMQGHALVLCILLQTPSCFSWFLLSCKYQQRKCISLSIGIIEFFLTSRCDYLIQQNIFLWSTLGTNLFVHVRKLTFISLFFFFLFFCFFVF